jgi:hypothetical protein
MAVENLLLSKCLLPKEQVNPISLELRIAIPKNMEEKMARW